MVDDYFLDDDGKKFFIDAEQEGVYYDEEGIYYDQFGNIIAQDPKWMKEARKGQKEYEELDDGTGFYFLKEQILEERVKRMMEMLMKKEEQSKPPLWKKWAKEASEVLEGEVQHETQKGVVIKKVKEDEIIDLDVCGFRNYMHNSNNRGPKKRRPLPPWMKKLKKGRPVNGTMQKIMGNATNKYAQGKGQDGQPEAVPAYSIKGNKMKISRDSKLMIPTAFLAAEGTENEKLDGRRKKLKKNEALQEFKAKVEKLGIKDDYDSDYVSLVEETNYERIECFTPSGRINIKYINPWQIHAKFKCDFASLVVRCDYYFDLPEEESLYYEVKLLTGTINQIGWVDPSGFVPSSYNGEGVGDDKWSWGFDGSRKLKFHDGEETKYGNGWSANDVLGCLYCPSKGKITYTLNGFNLQNAFDVPTNKKLCPAISCARDEEIEIMVQKATFKYFPDDDTALPFHHMLTEDVWDEDTIPVFPTRPKDQPPIPRRIDPFPAPVPFPAPIPSPAPTPAPVPSSGPTEKIVLSTLTGNFNFTPKGNTSYDVAAISDFPTAAIKYTSKTKLPSSKAIYYEVQVKSAGVSQFGWADIDNFAPDEGEGQGAGDQGKSWSFGGSDEANKLHEGDEEGYGKVWGANDVIGCKYNPSKGTISFSMNGSDMGVAFDGLQKNMKLCPVMTVDGEEHEKIAVFTHQNDMKHFQASDSCSLYDVVFGKAA